MRFASFGTLRPRKYFTELNMLRDVLPPEMNFCVVDPDSSRVLAIGHRLEEPEPSPLPFGCLRGNGVLLTYYFAKGKRDVRIQVGENEGIVAHLGTRWRSGHREWTLDW